MKIDRSINLILKTFLHSLSIIDSFSESWWSWSQYQQSPEEGALITRRPQVQVLALTFVMTSENVEDVDDITAPPNPVLDVHMEEVGHCHLPIR